MIKSYQVRTVLGIGCLLLARVSSFEVRRGGEARAALQENHQLSRTVSDIALENRIYSIINRDPSIPQSDVISVNVVAGEVHIGGIVDTWEEHKGVTHDAFVAGARVVINHLRVREDPVGSEKRFVYRYDPLSRSD